MGHQIHTDNLSGDAINLLLGLGQSYPPAFAATTGMDLGFYHHGVTPQCFGDLNSLVGGKGHTSLGDGHIILSK